VLAAALYLRQHAPTGETRVAPLDLLLDEHNVVQPDVFWISAANTDCVLINGQYWQGPPDLAIEVMSPSTVRRDYRDKYDLYQRHDVREYWIIEPIAPYLTVHVQDSETGTYVEQGSYRPGDRFESAALGQTIDVTALQS
jgi:Uma2 family endonuclease